MNFEVICSLPDQAIDFGSALKKQLFFSPRKLEITPKIQQSRSSFSRSKINRNCGLHVHVNVEDFTLKDMAILLAYWMKIENTLSFAIPSWRVDGAFVNERW